MNTQWLFETPTAPVAQWNTQVDWFDLETQPDRKSRAYILWVQQSLNRLLNLRLVVDGMMGQRTRQAIRQFQQRAKLSADGVVGTRTERALIAAGASPPPSSKSPAQPTKSVVPSLLGTESSPKNLTLYVNIPLGQGLKSISGIFIPNGYRPQRSVDLILYLHGHLGPSGLSSQDTIQQYWRKANFAFREKVNSSGKNVILVAPTLGPKSQAGNLIAAGGLTRYLDQVMAALGTYGPHKTLGPPVVGNIILAAHSGGGSPMRKLALSTGTYAANIKECWGFDCTYGGDATDWRKWATSRSSNQVFIYYIQTCKKKDSTKPKKYWPSVACVEKCLSPERAPDGKVVCVYTTYEARSLAAFKLPNAQVIRSSVSHNNTPITYWETRIKAAAFLRDR